MTDEPDGMAKEALMICTEADNETEVDNVQVPSNEIEVSEVDGMKPIPD
jgi:hypothetical protein